MGDGGEMVPENGEGGESERRREGGRKEERELGGGKSLRRAERKRRAGVIERQEPE